MVGEWLSLVGGRGDLIDRLTSAGIPTDPTARKAAEVVAEAAKKKLEQGAKGTSLGKAVESGGADSKS